MTDRIDLDDHRPTRCFVCWTAALYGVAIVSFVLAVALAVIRG